MDEDEDAEVQGWVTKTNNLGDVEESIEVGMIGPAGVVENFLPRLALRVRVMDEEADNPAS